MSNRSSNPILRPAVDIAREGTTNPHHLISRETLLYLGFTPSGADEIWRRWNSWGSDDNEREVDGGPVTFESMARAFLYGSRDGSGDNTWSDNDDDWYEMMTRCAIDQTLQSAIMTPALRSIRLTESCQLWLLDTISARYAPLVEIQAASRDRTVTASQEADLPGDVDAGNHQGEDSSPGQHPESESRPVSEKLAGTPGLSSISASAPEVRATTPGCTVLYRGGYLTTLRKIFDSNGNPKKMAALQTTRPGNFTSNKPGVYLVDSFSLAQKYAVWAKKRGPSQPVAILRMEVPNFAVDSLDGDERIRLCWPLTEWKTLVWNCRRRERLVGSLGKYARATLLIGSICGRPSGFIAGLDGPQDITERMVLTNGSNTDAMQYVFNDDLGLDFLEAHGAGNCTVHLMTAEHASEVEGEMELEIKIGKGNSGKLALTWENRLVFSWRSETSA